MRDHGLYPLRFQPIYRSYPWGGERISRTYRRHLPPGILAESWEVSDRPEAMSEVAAGPLAGRTLGDLVRERGSALVGTAAPAGPFPLLIKIVDAQERTSLQVHPHDGNAAAAGGEPKTEMWYALPASAPMRVWAGLRSPLGRAELERAVAEGDAGAIEAALGEVSLRPGQSLLIPGGCLHAIDAGCFLLEVQQNSDTTYRVHDWGRVGPDGRPRALHGRQALQVIEWDLPIPRPIDPQPRAGQPGIARWEILDSRHFRVERLELTGPARLPGNPRSFRLLFAETDPVTVEGGGQTDQIPAGGTCLVPAALESCRLVPPRERAPLISICLGSGSGAP